MNRIRNYLYRIIKKIFPQDWSENQDLKLITIYRKLRLHRPYPSDFCPILLMMSDEFRLQYNFQSLLNHYPNIKLRIIPGYHHTLFSEPYIKAMAIAIDEDISFSKSEGWRTGNFVNYSQGGFLRNDFTSFDGHSLVHDRKFIQNLPPVIKTLPEIPNWI